MTRRLKVEILAPGRADVPAHPDDAAFSRNLAVEMDRITERLRARNLRNAVLLAQQAARGEGPLVDHFCELGRVWGWRLLKEAPPVPARRAAPRAIERERA